jgi:hypothetical protein
MNRFWKLVEKLQQRPWERVRNTRPQLQPVDLDIHSFRQRLRNRFGSALELPGLRKADDENPSHPYSPTQNNLLIRFDLFGVPPSQTTVMHRRRRFIVGF